MVPLVDSTSNPALTALWADATPLTKFIDERAERLFRQTPAAPWLTVDAPGESSSLGVRIAAGVESYKNRFAARDKAKAATINDLVAGRLVGLGRPSGSRDLEKIEGLFWIGAEFVSGNSVKSRGRRMMTHVRILPSDASPSLQPKPRSGPGRPSQREAIKAAIVDHARADPGWWNRSPSVRHKGYRDHIAKQGYDPSGPGFDKKTLQKYETAFFKGEFK